MPLTFRFAGKNDLEKIIVFYQEVCAQQKNDQYSPDWHWNIYPTPQGLAKRVANHELFVGTLNKQIASAGFITLGEDYHQKDIVWQNSVNDNEIAVLHLFAVSKDFRGHGIATQMLANLKDYCQKQGLKAIHLDVLKGNLAAENLYKKFGFTFAAEKKLLYKDTGLTPAKIFEYKL